MFSFHSRLLGLSSSSNHKHFEVFQFFNFFLHTNIPYIVLYIIKFLWMSPKEQDDFLYCLKQGKVVGECSVCWGEEGVFEESVINTLDPRVPWQTKARLVMGVNTLCR